MSQNLIHLALDDAQLAAIDQALSTLETTLAGLISLDAEDRRSLARMGTKSEQFCRQTLTVLAENPQVVPGSIGLADARADLAVLDRLRPRFARLQRLCERAQDSETALGSDVMSLALEGYALLKLAGRGQGLDTLRRDLGNRFSKNRAQPARDASAKPAG